MVKKRLFLFAGYDAHAQVSDTLLFYLDALSGVGDIVLTMDCDLVPDEINKLNNIQKLVHVLFGRHGEYDFGSYKRGFLWCKSHDVLKSYDWIYFVNDSVFGPTSNIKPVLQKLEKQNTDVVGMFLAKNQWVGTPENKVPDHVQSWFIGVKTNIAQKKYFYEFMRNISKQPTKADIIMNYEVGLTNLLKQHKCSVSAVLTENMDKDLYRAPLYVMQHDVSFIKKSAIKYLSPTELNENVDSGLLQIIQRNNLYKQKKYKTIKRVKLCGLLVLTQKCHLASGKNRWFLFNCLPLM